MRFLNIAGYKFVDLFDLPALQIAIKTTAESFLLKGTVLLSPEGINLSLASTEEQMNQFKAYLNEQSAFNGMTFHQTYSSQCPFKRLKVKLKKEIIVFRQPNITPAEKRAPAISPQTLKKWLDEKKEFILLDTRNDYEIEIGAFQGASKLDIQHFCTFPEKITELPKEKVIVTYCTGGIRCEKAALHMMNAGFSEVYQLDGGILNYFKEVGRSHYDGKCYVFDERVAI